MGAGNERIIVTRDLNHKASCLAAIYSLPAFPRSVHRASSARLGTYAEPTSCAMQ